MATRQPPTLHCYSVEMQRALERHRRGEARVVPVFLRPTDWENAPFMYLQGLPGNGKAVTTWTDRDLAFTEIVRELRRVIQQQDRLFISPPSEHDREVMLKKVHDIWITGVLEQSLYREMLIELGLEKHPKLVENPWRIVVQETDQPNTPLPPGTSVTQVYDRTDGSLLLLGAPGSGKTTLLLSLTRTLLERAGRQKSELLPVVFHLSTWSQQQLPLEEWLVVELHDRYGIPRILGASWVKNKQLLLLLDGLDEVAPGARRKCIITINRYHEQFPFVPLVVCSRHQDYLDLSIRLQVHTAVLIQPLTDEQIVEYMMALDQEGAGLREVLQEDHELRTLARTPLLLNVLALAYQGKSHETINVDRIVGGAQERIFASYVERMLTRRSVDKHYSSQKITKWLVILAKQMKQQNQTLFSLEQMQPTWLPSAPSRHLYASGGVRAPGIVLGVLISLIFTCYLFVSTVRTPPAFITSCILIGALLGGFLSRTPRVEGSVAPTRESFKRRVFARGTVALSTGIAMGITAGPGVGTVLPGDTLAQHIAIGATGLGCFLFTFFIGADAPLQTANREEIDLSWKPTFHHFFRSPTVRVGGFVGGITILTIAIGCVLYSALSGIWNKNTLSGTLVVGPIIGLLLGLASALLRFCLGYGSGKIQVVERLTWTWQSIWQSLKNRQHVKNVLLVGLLLIAVGGLYIGLLQWASPVPNAKTLVTILIVILTPQRRSAGWKIRAILLVEVMLVLALTSGVSLFGEVQQHSYNISSAATARAMNYQYNATATVQAEANATAEAEANALPIVYPPTSMSPVLDDPLWDNSKGNRWEEDDSGHGHCKFIKRAYDIIADYPSSYGSSFCTAKITDFTNFIYEVQMKIVKGDGGGIAFRVGPTGEPSCEFDVYQDGYYYFSDSSSGGFANDSSPAIHQGLNQTNVLAAVVRGTLIELYVNYKRVAVVGRSTSTHGRIGLVAFGSQTEVIFQNAKVWKL